VSVTLLETRKKNKMKYGWKPDVPDHRDHVYSAPLAHLQALPDHVDLRPQFSFQPFDQKSIGSCTSQAIVAAFQFANEKEGHPHVDLSRMFVYYQERVLEHSIGSDSGAQIRDGIKSVVKFGIPPESEWPYDGSAADENTGLFPPGAHATQRPPPTTYQHALKHRAVSYSRVPQSLRQLQACLAAGFPIVFGFSVYSSLYDANGDPRSNVPMPRATDELLGGHATLICGFVGRQFIVRNSWGPDAQDNGHFYLPYEYVLDPNLADDFWVLHTVT